MKQALLLIDIQNDYFVGGACELVNPDIALKNTKKILDYFRKDELPIIHVQHVNKREGATFFIPNTFGVKIHKELTPLKNEHVVVKHVPNSFCNTDLLKILKENDISSLVICGMMTHMCIDTTTRVCKDYGLDVVLIEDTCATKDLQFNGETIPANIVHNSFMAALDGMFAKIIKTAEFV